VKLGTGKLSAAATAFAISVVATSWCWWLAGPGLALFLGSVVLAALYVPSLALAAERPASWITCCASSAGICAVWLASPARADISAGEWLRCAMVCVAFVFALSGLGAAAINLRMSRPIAATVIAFAAMAWLTWPIWLSPWLTQSMVDWLVPAHPLLAINGVLQHLGSWDRAPIAYRRLTILNQDIPYHLPRSVLPALAVHGVIGLLGFVPTHLPKRAAFAPSSGRGLG